MASPPLGPKALEALLGVWEGTAFHEGGTPMDLVVTFEAHGDTVRGTTTTTINNRRMGNGTPHAFIRMRGEGRTVEWGYPNPRGGGGMVVFSVSLQDDGELVGVQEIRGFEMELPAGFVMPVTHVTLKKIR